MSSWQDKWALRIGVFGNLFGMASILFSVVIAIVCLKWLAKLVKARERERERPVWFGNVAVHQWYDS